MLLQRTCILAGSATDTAARIDVRLLQHFLVALRIDDLNFLQINGFRRYRTPLFTNDAVGRHRPRQTSAAIVKRRTQADGFRVALANTDHPAFFLRRELPDRPGWANLRAEHAARLAISDARCQYRRPDAFQSCLGQRRLQRIVRTHLHAFAAADAARKEIRLFESSRWAN